MLGGRIYSALRIIQISEALVSLCVQIFSYSLHELPYFNLNVPCFLGEKMYLCEACDGGFSCGGYVTVPLENWLVIDSAEMWFIFILRGS